MRMNKMIVSIILFSILMLMLPAAAGASVTPVLLETETITEGSIDITYTQSTMDRLKVKITNLDTLTYRYYDLSPMKTESFPLQLGNGNYQIAVLKQIEGTRYNYIDKSEIRVQLEDENSVFLQSVQNIEWTLDMESIQLAQALTIDATSDREKAEAIYQYMINNFSYDYQKAATVQSGYRTDIESTFVEQKGICYDYAALTASMLRSVGVPTKVAKGYTSYMEGYHAWNEIYLESEGWVTVDTTVDAHYRAQGDAYSMIKSADTYMTQSEL